MLLSKTLTTVLLSASVAAASIVPLAGAASARDRDVNGSFNGGPRQVQQQKFGGDFNGGRGFGGRSSDRFEHRDWHGEGRNFRGSDHGWRDSHDEFQPRHRRDHSGRNIAIGAAAAILGLAIAAEANRSHRYSYRD